MVFKVIIV